MLTVKRWNVKLEDIAEIGNLKKARNILSRWGFVKHSDCKVMKADMTIFVAKFKIKEAAA